jgi:tetratricopeptide (TPR) repeat protein
MLRRILGWFVLSVSICLTQSFARQSLSDSGTETHPSSTTYPQASEAQISVVRLRVSGKAIELYNRALEALAKQEVEDANKKVEQALKIYPNYPDALTLRGAVRHELHRCEAATQDFQASIDADATFAPAYIGLADVLNDESRFDDALVVLQRADQLNPGAWNIQYEISRSLIGQHLYGRALNVLEEALRAGHARYSLLRLAKAHALAALGKLPEAAQELQTYLSSGPVQRDDEEARNLLNQIQAAIGGQ